MVSPIVFLSTQWDTSGGAAFFFTNSECRTPREQKVLICEGAKIYQQYYQDIIAQFGMWEMYFFVYIISYLITAAKLIYVSIWSDEYLQFEYRSKLYRIVLCRFLNCHTIVDHPLGVFPAGAFL